MGSAAIQGELWSAGAADWAELQEPMCTPLFEAMLKATSVGAGTRMLDAGCGAGTASLLAAERGAQVAGLDAAPALVAVAAARVPGADFRVGELEELPYADDSFDVVIAANAVQYTSDRAATMRELSRVCRPVGRVALAVWALPDKVDFKVIFKAVVEMLPEPPPGDGPFGLSSPEKVHDLFSRAGMTVVDHGEVNCPFHYPNEESFWRATRSGGPIIGAMRKVGEEKVRQSVLRAVQPMTTSEGAIHLRQNYFQYFVASVND